MRIVIMMIWVSLSLFSASIEWTQWKKGEAFSNYLEKNGVSVGLLRRISAEDKQYLSEIQAGEWFYELRDKGKLIQALIPLGEEMQIHLSKDQKEGVFHFDIIPVVCQNLRDVVSFKIEKGLYEDIDRWTKNPRLGYLLKKHYGKTVRFKRLHKGDTVAFVYTQRARLGKPYGSPAIEASLIRNGEKNHFIFLDADSIGYDNIYKDVAYKVRKEIRKGLAFVRPIQKMRITSKFTYKRWHPILKRYRPHLGVDIGAKRGTPIHATHAGKIIYAGWMGGYGKVVKIRHAGGFVSLYAHQSKLLVKRGQYVNRGQVIGRVGSTGRSTAPHLHFGLYKNAKAVNPMQYIGKKSTGKKYTEVRHIVKHKRVQIEGALQNKKRLLQCVGGKQKAFRWQSYVKPYNLISERKKYEQQDYTF